MKLERVAVMTAVCSALMPLEAAAAVCSSLNGPYCSGVSRDFRVPPYHASSNLDRDDEEVKRSELARRVRVENVLKQYEIEATLRDDVAAHDQILEELEMLLDDSVSQLERMQGVESESAVIGSFAFSNEGDTFDLLNTMNGKDMKEFFEGAFDEVLQSWDTTLDDMSPEITQGLRTSVKQLRKLKDYKQFPFQYLDESAREQIRRRFKNHRLVEVQRLFEQLIIAQSARERHVAYEAVVLLFQMADEFKEEGEDKANGSAVQEGDALQNVDKEDVEEEGDEEDADESTDAIKPTEDGGS